MENKDICINNFEQVADISFFFEGQKKKFIKNRTKKMTQLNIFMVSKTISYKNECPKLMNFVKNLISEQGKNKYFVN
jgi:hypothetical protein